MDIHKPKPWHGARELLKEIGIIVIGVLIALGAEQAVETLHWRHEVAAAEEGWNSDIRRIVSNGAEREAVDGCLFNRMTEIGRMIDAASASGRLPPTGSVGRAATRAWRFQTWDGTAGLVATHLPSARYRDYARAADDAAYMEALGSEERSAWDVLSTMTGPGRRLSDTEANTLRLALTTARNGANRLRLTSGEVAQRIQKDGLISKAAWDEAVKAGVAKVPLTSACRPIGPASAQYDARPTRATFSFRSKP